MLTMVPYFLYSNRIVQKMWLKYDWPLAKIGLKLANGQLFFCTLSSLLCIIHLKRKKTFGTS